MLPVAADVECEGRNGVPLRLDVETVGGSTVRCGNRRTGCRELLERHASEFAPEDIDVAVDRLRLGAEAQLVVVDLFRLWGAAAQIVEAREVDALVDTAKHRHIGRDLVVRT